MKQKILGGFQLLLTTCMSATIGSPQSAFSSIQHFMLNEHIYEERCKLTNALETSFPKYCLQSRTAYVNVYNSAGLGFAIAVIPAYYSVRYFGFAFTNICCCLILAAGSVLITDRSEDQWLTDRFAYGYAFCSMAAPFAIFNGLKAISYIHTSRITRLTMLAGFVSLLQLGPLVWIVFSWQFAENIALQDLFRSLLWVPVIWTVSALLLMPLSDVCPEFSSDVLLQLLKSQFSLGGKSSALKYGFSGIYDSPRNPGDTEIEEQQQTSLMPQPTDPSDYNHKPTYLRTVFSRPFFALLLVYFANSLPLDLMFVGGEARAAFHEELSVWSELTVMSPAIATAVFPIIFWLTSWLGIKSLTSFTCLFSILHTIAQYWSVRFSWLTSSFLVGSCQAALTWTTALCFIKCVRAELFSITSVIFLVGSAILKFVALPTIDVSIEFDESILGYNPYVLILCLQVVASLFLWLVLRVEVGRERRYYLELEARSAFDADISI